MPKKHKVNNLEEFLFKKRLKLFLQNDAEIKELFAKKRKEFLKNCKETDLVPLLAEKLVRGWNLNFNPETSDTENEKLPFSLEAAKSDDEFGAGSDSQTSTNISPNK